MSEVVLVALITAVPATITAVATLLEVLQPSRDAERTPRDGDRVPPPPPAPAPHRPGPLPRRGSPLRLPTIVVGGLLLTVAVGFVAASMVDGEDGDDVVVVTTTVPGTRRWTDTGVTLEVGDEVTITASGEVFHSVESQRKAGPDGESGTRFPSNVLMSADHGALLGMVGGDGEPFFVGSHHQFRVASGGQLFFGINDTGVENNTGQFRAEVTVRRAGD